jgi:hypothetical protein
VSLFLAAFAIRFYGSQKLPINSHEASILLKITGRTTVYPEGFSIIESLLIKISFFIFSDSDLAARIWPIIAGSILTLLPLYLGRQLNPKNGVMLSLLIAIDPFMVVNSIQLGSNIFAFLAFTFLLGAIWKRDRFLVIMNLILLSFSGRGVMLAMILSIAFLIYLKVNEGGLIENYIEESKEWWKKNNAFIFPKLLILGLLVIIGVTIVKIDISLTLSDLITNLEYIPRGYTMGESPLAFGVVLISYLPLYIVLFSYWLINLLNKEKRPENILILWIAIALLFISINPYHKFIDLLWVSGPMILYSSFATPIIFQRKNFNNTSSLVRTLIFLILLIALSMSFSSFIYQGYTGLPQFNTLISLIIILVVIAAFVVFLTYQYNLKHSFLSLINATFIMLFVVQIGFSFRACGLSSSRYSEVLWAGAIFDKQIIQNQIGSEKQTREFTSDSIKIGLLDLQEPSILWELRAYDVKSFRNNLKPNEKFDILISQRNFIEGTKGKYYGQEFIVDAFPKWTIEPIRSLWFYDYWSWLIFRKSKMYKSLNNIWVNAE